MSVPHHPMGYSLFYANRVTETLDQVWTSLFLTLRPAETFHGHRATARLTTGRRPSGLSQR
jgi:hypothetical protein